jgi:glycerol kinase
MKTKRFILTIDQGTTFTKTFLFDNHLDVAAGNTARHSQINPQAGWVEHDGIEILDMTMASIRATMKSANVKSSEISAIGISNQGETVIAWDATTGKPLHNAIVWQDRRTAKVCDELGSDSAFARKVRGRTGLFVDPYFSATKLQWLMEHVPAVARAARQKNLLMGTMDSWLVWNLSGRKAFVTDHSTASRTMLFNLKTLRWDSGLLSAFKIKQNWLPDVRPSKGICGVVSPLLLGGDIPITALLCDQQAALLGHGCVHAGQAKCTYGTGAFLLLNVGDTFIRAGNGLLTSIAWSTDKGVQYVYDGGVHSAGSAVDWLRDDLAIVRDVSETDTLASSVDSTEGVAFVPALTGLASPYWDSTVRGCFLGINSRTSRAHIARAVLEGIAFRVRDVFEAMNSSWPGRISSLYVDGGLTQNRFLMEFQADVLGVTLKLPRMSESTSLGVAYLAGSAINFWKDKNILQKKNVIRRVYLPQISKTERDRKYQKWKNAVAAAAAYSRSNSIHSQNSLLIHRGRF